MDSQLFNSLDSADKCISNGYIEIGEEVCREAIKNVRVVWRDN